jgi:hypothetical protein
MPMGTVEAYESRAEFLHPVMDKYDKSTLGNIVSTPITSKWLGHRGYDIMMTSWIVFDGNEIEQGIVDTGDQVSDKQMYRVTKGIWLDVEVKR